jgi:hypothetical protein
VKIVCVAKFPNSFVLFVGQSISNQPGSRKISTNGDGLF